MSDQRILMWFRADLRVSDNAAFWHAVHEAQESGSAVIACFLIAGEQWAEHDWAGIRVDFLLRSLRELSDELAMLNVPLLIAEAPRFSDAPRVLLDLARTHACRRVYFNKEYELNEMRRDAAVSTAFTGAGLKARGFTDQTLIEPGEVRTANGTGGYFTVFTPFKRALYRLVDERGGVSLYVRPKKQAPLPLRSSNIPDKVSGFVSHVNAPEQFWPAGEKSARRMLEAFIQHRLRGYKSARNTPALDGSSTLSPALAAGTLSVRQCVHAAREANRGLLDGGDESAACWISELAWREFYKHIIVGYPRVCMGRAFKPDTDRIRWSHDQAAFDAWREGRTGVPIVDAGMRQLLALGWMHNRARMIVAMFLTKDLLIDWRWGEKHFMRHLIDGDLAANNGGWQWSASTGTDAAPYFRIFNPVSQSRTCDPDGEYIRKYVPELASLEGGPKGAIHDPSQLAPLARARIEYPEPIVDHAKARARVMKTFQALG